MSSIRLVAIAALLCAPTSVVAQGVTTAALHGVVTGEDGVAISRANVLALHVSSGTQYRALSTTLGAYNLPNLRVGGPYRLTVTLLGYEPQTRDSLFLDLGQTLRHDFRLIRRAVQIAGVAITTERDPTLNAGRTGAATSIAPELVIAVPSIKRSTRDLTRLDPRSDGNFSFGGRNWLY
ncbi:MAG: carboxypeptidase-like regulatory domain-containing protein, partial [Gemmatimonadaceae bacterium]